eukprot:1152980-Alexandrium_andersonii.AAC.1
MRPIQANSLQSPRLRRLSALGDADLQDDLALRDLHVLHLEEEEVLLAKVPVEGDGQGVRGVL